MGLFENVTEYMESHHMLTDARSVVVGVSGGADSVALLRLLCQRRDRLAIAEGVSPDKALSINVIHINHMIRGEEANRDQEFVRALCEKLKVSFKVYSKDIPQMARNQHLSEEEAGRLFRYECFQREADELLNNETRNNEGVQIAVAHNKDDLTETVLFNMVRGSSLLGLAGIKPVNGQIIRPLLMTSRSEIEDYLAELDQDYITDSTNLSPDYSRNKIRLSIIPQLKEINASAIDHIVEVAMDATRLNQDINVEIRRDYYKGQEPPEDSPASLESYTQSISISDFNGLSSLARGELVLSMMEKLCGRRKDITREHIRSVCSLAEQESGKSVDLPYRMRARRSYDEIILEINIASQNAAQPGINVGDSEIIRPSGTISTDIISYDTSLDLSKKEYTKLIDYDKINFVPVLRTPQPEDFIVISSDGGRKKLSRFFTHSKIDRDRRKDFPVVADGDEIIWVVGLRLSERYKVTDNTKRVMKITYTEK